MRFATILREAGFSSKEFKNCAEIPIVLYDRKDRIISDDVHFVDKLFRDNQASYEKFYAFLITLEKGPSVSSMDVKIDETSVILFYKSPNFRIFSRMSFLD